MERAWLSVVGGVVCIASTRVTCCDVVLALWMEHGGGMREVRVEGGGGHEDHVEEIGGWRARAKSHRGWLSAVARATLEKHPYY